MKKLTKKMAVLFAAMVMVISAMTLVSSAAVSWPSYGTSRPIKVYTITTANNTKAYTSTSLSTKKGTIYASDEIYIYSIGKNSKGCWYAYCSYPVTGSSSRKYAYIPLSAVTKATSLSEKRIATAAIKTYRRASTSTTAGSISSGDYVYKLTTSGNYTQVLYNIGSTSNTTGWRMAWVKTTDYTNSTRSSSAVSISSATVTLSCSSYTYDGSAKKPTVTVKYGSKTLTNGTHYSVSYSNNVNAGTATVTVTGKGSYYGTKKVTFTIKAASSSTTSSGSWQYPATSAYCTWSTKTNMSWGGYNYSSSRPSRSYHLGIDIASSTGDTKIYAAASGTVAAVGYNSANGNYVIIKHTLSGKTVYSFYAHLSSYSVSKGQSVSKGTKIGIIGKTGSASGVHLHFAVVDTLWTNGKYYGYGSYFNGSSVNKVTYSGVTYYNPYYIIKNGKLPS